MMIITQLMKLVMKITHLKKLVHNDNYSKHLLIMIITHLEIVVNSDNYSSEKINS